MTNPYFHYRDGGSAGSSYDPSARRIVSNLSYLNHTRDQHLKKCINHIVQRANLSSSVPKHAHGVVRKASEIGGWKGSRYDVSGESMIRIATEL